MLSYYVKSTSVFSNTVKNNWDLQRTFHLLESPFFTSLVSRPFPPKTDHFDDIMCPSISQRDW